MIKSYLMVMECYHSGHLLQTRVAFESHIGFHLVQLLTNVSEEWQPTEKAVVLVTDNAPNMMVIFERRSMLGRSMLFFVFKMTKATVNWLCMHSLLTHRSRFQ